MIPIETSNRHGLIAGTTGSGKTITLCRLAADWHSRAIPVCMVDCKGDIGGIVSRVSKTVTLRSPTVPIGELSPGDVAGLLGASDAQADALAELWSQADSAGRALVTLEDVSKGALYLRDTGAVPPATAAALNRAITSLAASGFDEMFQVPVFLPKSLIRPEVSIIDARAAIQRPEAYRALLSWLLGELLTWGESSGLELVLLVDEAHVLFGDKSAASAALVAMRMLRSRGVGVYFATQSPEDLPEQVLSLLGHRIIHSLRVYTPGARARAAVLARECAVSVQELTTQATGHACRAILSEDGRPVYAKGLIDASGLI